MHAKQRVHACVTLPFARVGNRYANARMLQAECHMELAEFSEAANAYAALLRTMHAYAQ